MRIVLTLLLALLLGGCFTSGKRGGERDLAIHDFGAPAASTLLPGGRNGVMAIEVRAPLWMDSLGIHYRLAYADASRLREYARSRWAGPPAQLIEQRLMQRLDLVPSGLLRGKCVWRVELTEFSQVFASPADSEALLLGHVYWLDARRQTLADRRVQIRQPATSADARGGVAALQAGVDRLAGELLAWERELFASGRAGACGA